MSEDYPWPLFGSYPAPLLYQRSRPQPSTAQPSSSEFEFQRNRFLQFLHLIAMPCKRNANFENETARLPTLDPSIFPTIQYQRFIPFFLFPPSLQSTRSCTSFSLVPSLRRAVALQHQFRRTERNGYTH